MCRGCDRHQLSAEPWHRSVAQSLLRRSGAHAIFTRVFPVSGYGYGFDVEIANASALPAGMFYWGGGLGTHFWMDPKNRVVAIFMTQTLPSGLDGETEKLAALVYGALTQP